MVIRVFTRQLEISNSSFCCEGLGRLSNTINLKSLTTLILSRCSTLKSVRILELHLDGTAIKRATNIDQAFDWPYSAESKRLQEFFESPRSILFFFESITGCCKLNELPENLVSLECLQHLEGSRSAIRQ